MAKLPSIVTAIAEVDGRDRPSVDHVARTIRERGYISTGKRGGGAADVQPHEVANLLIALNGADSAKEGPLAIDRFRSLRQMYAGTSADFKRRLAAYDELPKPLQDVMDVHTFGEALDALIEGVPDLAASFRQYVAVAYEFPPEKAEAQVGSMIRLSLLGLAVTFSRYAGKIEMFTMNGSERRVEFEAAFIKDTDRLDSGFYGNDWPDRSVRVTIGFYTLARAWQALNPGTDLPGFPAPSIAQAGDAE
jgi:hypothetical protein